MIKINRGLDLPIAGAPQQVISDGPKVRSVAVIGYDYNGMKPTMEVKVGDHVKTGQVIFTDKKTPGVKYSAPATGVVTAINRGDKRVFQSLAIDVEEDQFAPFEQYSDLSQLTRQQVVDNLVNSGQWTAIRTRPFSKIPAIDSAPHSVFVSAMDTHPLAADPAVVISTEPSAFVDGLQVLSKLTEGALFLAKAPGVSIDTGSVDIKVEEFAGPHPAGLTGTHMHYLAPVSATKVAWHVNYQDVIAIGKLFTEGQLYTDRVISLAGPRVESPCLIKTRLGANLDELTAGKLVGTNNRIVSGSVLGGRTSAGAIAYLGRYHQQVSVLEEGNSREFLGWLSPGANKHSNMNIYLSQFSGNKEVDMTTTTNGSERAMVPVGSYEKIMPLDILPTQLLRSLIVGDTQMAQNLGCLELDEEDLALCCYVCPGKYEYGPILRDNLTRIEKEG